jgi:hypothetical protein
MEYRKVWRRGMNGRIQRMNEGGVKESLTGWEAWCTSGPFRSWPCVRSSEIRLVLGSCLSWKKGVRAKLVKDVPWHRPNLTRWGHVQTYVSRPEACTSRCSIFVTTPISTYAAPEGTLQSRFVTLCHVYIKCCLFSPIQITHVDITNVHLVLILTWPRTRGTMERNE